MNNDTVIRIVIGVGIGIVIVMVLSGWKSIMGTTLTWILRKYGASVPSLDTKLNNHEPSIFRLPQLAPYMYKEDHQVARKAHDVMRDIARKHIEQCSILEELLIETMQSARFLAPYHTKLKELHETKLTKLRSLQAEIQGLYRKHDEIAPKQ